MVCEWKSYITRFEKKQKERPHIQHQYEQVFFSMVKVGSIWFLRESEDLSVSVEARDNEIHVITSYLPVTHVDLSQIVCRIILIPAHCNRFPTNVTPLSRTNSPTIPDIKFSRLLAFLKLFSFQHQALRTSQKISNINKWKSFTC